MASHAGFFQTLRGLPADPVAHLFADHREPDRGAQPGQSVHATREVIVPFVLEDLLGRVDVHAEAVRLDRLDRLRHPVGRNLFQGRDPDVAQEQDGRGHGSDGKGLCQLRSFDHGPLGPHPEGESLGLGNLCQRLVDPPGLFAASGDGRDHQGEVELLAEKLAGGIHLLQIRLRKGLMHETHVLEERIARLDRLLQADVQMLDLLGFP